MLWSHAVITDIDVFMSVAVQCDFRLIAASLWPRVVAKFVHQGCIVLMIYCGNGH